VSPPLYSERIRDQWLTPAEIAAEYGRCERTVQRWCVDGTLRDFGFLVVRSGNSWWIRSTVSTT
jgi:hypothetical protein